MRHLYGTADFIAAYPYGIDSRALRGFVGIDLSRESAPDATTLLQFRHLLEKHELTKQVFEAINGQWSAAGLMMREGTIADATILAAPPSVKNEAQARDPEMHQTKKGNQWYFGMKAHAGVDAESGLVHTVVGTAANVADVTQTGQVLHGEEKTVYLDAGYTGVEKREELKDRDCVLMNEEGPETGGKRAGKGGRTPADRAIHILES